jgi:hypothetical protein
MTTIGSGQSQTILQGQSDGGDVVLSGGTETVAAIARILGFSMFISRKNRPLTKHRSR